MKLRSLIALALFFSAVTTARTEEVEARAQELARELWRASGGENWSRVKTLDFTFIVSDQGKELARAQHHWDVAAGTDHVKWKDKDVTVDLNAPPQEGDGKAAYARWVNDAYWLLAPLKVLDPGVKLTAEGEKETDGVRCETLRLSFAQVGLTPGDQYLLYLDPQTKLLRAWDYMPKPETTLHGTWEKYETHGGLTLATEHNFAGKMIRFADLKVVTE